MNLQEARTQWLEDKPVHEARGVYLPGVTMYLPDEWKRDYRMAMDAQPTLSTDPNSAIPSLLTTVIDPKVIRIVFTPLNFAKILGEQKNGDWLEETRIFPVVEETGEVSSYGDFNNNGRAGVNLNFPNFQAYLFQTFVRYGERELERAGLAKINYVSELEVSAADLLNRYQNLSYAFGISGLQNSMSPPPACSTGTRTCRTPSASPACRTTASSTTRSCRPTSPPPPRPPAGRPGSSAARRTPPPTRSTTTSSRWWSASSARPTAPWSSTTR